MQIYLVGGAIRDELLGLPVTERDYVVVGAEPGELLAQNFTQVNPDFPVFNHPKTGHEYALARREHKIGVGYKGFSIETGPDITLEEDLARRDLTINAIARDQDGNLIDPWHGLKDIQDRRLRHITPAFQEDPVRLLRIARFATRLGHLGFAISHPTFKLMRGMVDPTELQSLVPQRFREELLKAIMAPEPWRFLTTLHRCGALVHLLPELATAMEPLPASHTNATQLPVQHPIAVLQRSIQQTNDRNVIFTALISSTTDNPITAVKICKHLKLERAVEQLTSLVLNWPAVKLVQAQAQDLLSLLDKKRLWQNIQLREAFLQVLSIIDPDYGPKAGQRLTQAIQAWATVSIASLAPDALAALNLGDILKQRRLHAIKQIVGN